jgi:hypothetical protein
MTTGLIIVIVLAALVGLALLAVFAGRGEQRRLDQRREQAGELRREAELHDARAQGARAEAQERAARAEREQAIARERTVRAEEHGRQAESLHLEAAELDPDSDPRELGQARSER